MKMNFNNKFDNLTAKIETIAEPTLLTENPAANMRTVLPGESAVLNLLIALIFCCICVCQVLHMGMAILYLCLEKYTKFQEHSEFSQ